MSKPLAIGLVGAPGTGKREIIDALGELWANSSLEQEHGGLRKVASPGRDIESNCDQAMGPFGSYREDLWTAIKYIEYDKYFADRSFITPGTILSSLAHAAAGMENIALGLQSPQTAEQMNQYQMVAAVLTMLWIENWRYDFVFYLPYKERLQPENPIAYQHGKKVDVAIQGILASFGYLERIQRLKGTDSDECAQEIFETITQITQAAASLEADDEVAIPDGSAAS